MHIMYMFALWGEGEESKHKKKFIVSIKIYHLQQKISCTCQKFYSVPYGTICVKSSLS
jgi:hypothetical protein